MTGSLIVEILSWTILAALAVYIILNASRVAVAITSLGNWATTEESVMIGSSPYPLAKVA